MRILKFTLALFLCTNIIASDNIAVYPTYVPTSSFPQSGFQEQETATATSPMQSNKSSRQNLAQNKNSVPTPRWPLTPNKPKKKIKHATNTITRTGLTFVAATSQQTNVVPPDSSLAVGFSQILVMINGKLITFNKTTGKPDGILNTTPERFFAVVHPRCGVQAPRVRFDQWSKRWFICAIDNATPTKLLLAVSDSQSITSTTIWTQYAVDYNAVQPATSSSTTLSYPTLGIDRYALYIGGNVVIGNSIVNADAFVIQKASMLQGERLGITAFRNLIGTTNGMFSPQGVDVLDNSTATGYFVGVDAARLGTIVIRQVLNPDSNAPTLSRSYYVVVPTTGTPLSVPSSGTVNPLDSLDDRLTIAHIRNNKLWTVHNIGVNTEGIGTRSATQTAARWYQINLGDIPTLIQAGTVYQSSNYWMPSIMTNGQGHMIVGSSTAAKNSFINAAYAARLAIDPKGTQHTVKLLTHATTSYNQLNKPLQAWGFYSTSSIDPSDNMTMWTIQQYCNNKNEFAVIVAKILAPPPALPVTCSPARIRSGSGTTRITLTAQVQENGASYFDPGLPYPKKLTLKIGNNVIVQRVICKNRLTIQADVSTLTAAKGNAIITITNPDGQQIRATNILTIT